MLILRHGGGNHVAVARCCCRGRDGAGVEPSLTSPSSRPSGRAMSRAVSRSTTSFACLNTDRVQLFNSSNKVSSINWLTISLSVNVSSASRFMAAFSQQNVDGLVPRDCLKSLTHSLANLDREQVGSEAIEGCLPQMLVHQARVGVLPMLEHHHLASCWR